MPYKCQIPHIYSMLGAIPEPDLPENESTFWKAVAWELSKMMEYGATAQEPQIVLNKAHKAEDQYIWEFYVNDLALPVKNAHNWHGQNVSQWLYAGAIVLQNREVSTHH